MTDVKKLQTLDGILDYPDPSDSSTGTTEQEFQEYLKNNHDVIGSMVAMSLWQPSAEYAVGQVLLSPNMPVNTIARVTTAGTTGSAEPVWESAGSTISDGTVTYTMLQRTLDFATSEEVTKGTNSSKVVTPSSLAGLLQMIYAQAKLDAHPVGSIYESTSAESPESLFGGTWEEMDAGRVLVAQGTGSTGTTFAAGATGGEEKHTLTVSEMPSHSHSANSSGEHTHSVGTIVGGSSFLGTHSGNMGVWGSATTSSAGSHTHTINNTGGGSAHNNMPPYTVIYRWKRTA